MSRLIRHWAPACAGVTIFLAFVFPAQAGTQYPGVGRTATPAEIQAWDIDVRPDFKGLPAGSGSVEHGQKIWDDKCASCHGTFGESNEVFTPLVGGTTAQDVKRGRVRALVTGDVARTTFMKLSSLSTLWDYIRRAMPWTAPKSLSIDEVYAVVAYMLNLSDIVPGDFVLSDRNIREAQEKLPNRDGMSRSHGLWDVKGKGDVANIACMKDCATEVKLASSFPESARELHGDPADQNRTIGAKSVAAAKTGVQATGAEIADLAKRKACLSCHGIDRRVVGPAFKEIAAKYKGEAGIEAKLVQKLRRGGSGVWGPLAMPPNPDLAESDAAALIHWVLGL